MRFWTKVQKTEGCWLWTGSHDRDGYGFFWDGTGDVHNPRMMRATHFAYRLLVGPIPDGLILLHSCDTPACVNPAHLTPGTEADNSADMVVKGRSAVTTNAHAKLTAAQVQEIRARYQRKGYEKRGSPTQAELAREYGVSQCQIGKIVLGRSHTRTVTLPSPAPNPRRTKPRE